MFSLGCRTIADWVFAGGGTPLDAAGAFFSSEVTRVDLDDVSFFFEGGGGSREGDMESEAVVGGTGFLVTDV